MGKLSFYHTYLWVLISQFGDLRKLIAESISVKRNKRRPRAFLDCWEPKLVTCSTLNFKSKLCLVILPGTACFNSLFLSLFSSKSFEKKAARKVESKPIFNQVALEQARASHTGTTYQRWHSSIAIVMGVDVTPLGRPRFIGIQINIARATAMRCYTPRRVYEQLCTMFFSNCPDSIMLHLKPFKICIKLRGKKGDSIVS